MALFAALPIAAMMMFSSYYGGLEGNPCPPPGNDYYTVLVPVPGDCSSFYACSNGVPVLQHCPDGLHFNDELDTCEVPRDAGCEDSDTSEARSCFNTITSNTQGAAALYCGTCRFITNSVGVGDPSGLCYP